MEESLSSAIHRSIARVFLPSLPLTSRHSIYIFLHENVSITKLTMDDLGTQRLPAIHCSLPLLPSSVSHFGRTQDSCDSHRTLTELRVSHLSDPPKGCS